MTFSIPENARCPSCGRFVGPYTRCPYCGARIKGRIALRAIKIVAILLAVVGLTGLWLYARTVDIPTLRIADAQATTNMAYVRVEGRVVRSLTFDPESGYLAFWLDDGSGELRVSIYRSVTEALLAQHKIPALGDHLRVAGTLRVREDYVSLTVNAADHLEIERPQPVTLQIGEITALDEGLRVHVAGEVGRVYSPYEGLTIVTVRDATGEIAATVNETTIALSGHPLPEIAEGQGIEITGTVTLYKSRPQITPATVDDIRLLASPVAQVTSEARTLASLSTDDEGSRVQVEGEIIAMEGFKGGVKATLDDATDQVILLLWQRVYGALEDPTAFDVGAKVTVEGEVQVYQGELEVVPDAASDITIRQPAPPIPQVDVGELSAVDVGQLVRVRGVLGTPKPFSAGIKLPLDDGTGTITVLLWTNIAQALPASPSAGETVEIVGVVESYKGELEIIPRSPVDWRPLP